MLEKDAAYASFEQKWLDANPEQAAVSIFLEPARREKASAFGTLIHEIAQTTFAVREPQIAAAKLGWWQQELSHATKGNSRHPISRELFRASATSVDNVSWRDLIDGAIVQLDAPPAANFDELCTRLAEFYVPVAVIDARLNGGDRVDEISKLWIGSHLLATFRSPTSEPFVVPLDLLARHGVTRSDLAQSGPARLSVLKDFVSRVRDMIGENIDRADQMNIGRRVRARLDLRLAAGAVKSNDPALYVATRYYRIRWRSAWLAWREARAAQKAT